MKRFSFGLLCALFVLGSTLGAEERNTTGRLTAAGGIVVLDVAGMGTGAIQVTGTYVGTVSFEVSVNGGDWVAVDMALPSTPGTDVNSTTTTGLYTGSVAGTRALRARMSAWTSGAAEISLSAAGTGGGGGGSATIDLSGGSFSGNAAASATGAAVPASADYVGISVAGTLTGLVAGQATMANSIPVTLASNQGAITVGDGAGALNVIVDSSATITVTDGAGALNTIIDSGTITLPVGASTAAKQPALGTAGTASTDVITVQGITSMTPLLATLSAETTKAIGVVRLADGSGNLVASNANAGTRAIAAVIYDASGNAITAFSGSGGTSSNFGSAVPSAGTAAGLSDGTNMQLGRVVDSDTGAGTVYVQTVNPVFRASGGPVEAGTSSNPYNVVFPSAQAVTCAACAATIVDDAAFTVATTPVTPVGGTYKVTRDAVNDGDAGAFAMNINRAIYASLETPLGDSVMDDTLNSVVVSPSGGAMTVTGQGTFSVQGGAAHDGPAAGFQPLTIGGYASAAAPSDVSADNDAVRAWYLRNGSGVQNLAAGGTLITATSTSLNTNITAGTVTTVSTLTSLSQLGGVALPIEDAAETAAGVGIYAMAVRRDTAASSSTTTGDNSTVNTDVLGKLWVTGTYPEDAAHSGGETLTAIGCRRIDTAATSAGASGDWATVDCDAEGKAWVNAFPTTPVATTYLPIRISDGTNFLTASQDQTHDAAIATNAGPLTMGYASAAAPTNVSADGDAVAAWFLRNGSQVSNLAAGSTLITSTGTSLNVNVTGGGTAGTQFAEDSAHTTADIGTMVLGVRNTVPTDLSAGATAGDYEPFGVSTTGQIFVAPAGYVAADGAAAAVNPVLGGCYASQAAPSDVSADNDATKLWCLRNGAQVVNLAVGGTLLTATSTSLNTNVTAGTITTVSTVTAVSDAQVQGKAATDAAVSGNPVYVGARASAAAPTDMSADGDATPFWLLRSGALASQPTFAGVLAVAGNGASGTGVQRVTIANDSTGILATVSTVTNLSQFGGAAINLGSGTIGTGTLRMNIATDDPVNDALVKLDASLVVEDVAETAAANLIGVGSVRRDTAASSAGASGDNATLNTTALGALWTGTIDPCSSMKKIHVAINQTTGTQLLTGTASNRTYICQISLVTATAQNIALVSGTGTVCATSLGPMLGGTTAGTGWNFAANGGIVLGDGSASVTQTDTDADNVCLLTSSTGQISGGISYVVAPN